jgi:Na+-transporting NADH:ubiquinone oxidoreductase subunit NqrD
MEETLTYGKNIILNHLTRILRLKGYLKTTVIQHNPSKINIIGTVQLLSVNFDEDNLITITITEQLSTEVAISICNQLQKELPGLKVELDAKPTF